jgi:hypothetical protein
MIVFGSTYTSTFSIWMSTDPKGNKWKPLVDSFEIGGWDLNSLLMMMEGFTCKPVQISSTLGAYYPNFAVDESIKTYWSAASAERGEWIQSDLGALSTVHAIQINYADQDVEFFRKSTNVFHQYKLYSSEDGKNWKLLIDKSGNKTDVPHDYVELENPVQARFIKLENIHMPTGKFAISGLRVFGKGKGKVPVQVKNFFVLRTEKDKRSSWIKWSPVDEAYAYNIYMGTSPDKLYNNILIHGANEYYYKGMDLKKTYYFQIEAINEAVLGSGRT